MYRACRACQIIDFLHFYIERKRNIVPYKLETRRSNKVPDVILATGEKVIDTNDIATFGDEPIAEMAS
jgi:hypothetical protein